MKFCGVIGYCETVEGTGDAEGNWEDVVTEHVSYGDILSNNRKYEPNQDTVNDDLNVNNRISIVADAFVWAHINAIKYLYWMGQRWKVTSVEIQRPRLILSIGGEYNGPTPSPPPKAEESV